MKDLRKDHYCVFIHWDCFTPDSKHHLIKCYFAEIPPKQFESIKDAAEFWYIALRKGYGKIYERKLHFVLDNKPGDVFFNGKRVTRSVQAKLNHLQTATFNSIFLSRSNNLKMDDLLSKIKGDGLSYHFKEFRNSQFSIYESNDRSICDFIVIPSSEILKRFYLFTSKICKQIDTFGLNYELESNPLFDPTRSRRIGNKIFITLNKIAEHNFHGVWAKFLWNPHLGRNIRRLFGLKTGLKIGEHFNIDIEWPEPRLIDEIRFEGRIWENPSTGEKFLIATETMEISNEPEWKEVKIRYKPKNDNEQILGSNPETRDVTIPELNIKNDKDTEKEVVSTDGHRRGGTKKSVPIKKRGYLLFDTNSGEKKKKTDQKTKNNSKWSEEDIDDISDGESQDDSTKGELDKTQNDNTKKRKRKKKQDDSDDDQKKDPEPVPYPKYWNLIDELYYQFLDDEELTAKPLIKSTIVSKLDNVSTILEINMRTEDDWKDRVNEGENFVQRSVYLNSKSDKKLRKIRSIQFTITGKKFQFIEVEPLSTGSNSYMVLDKWLSMKNFARIYLKSWGKQTELKASLSSKYSTNIRFRNHPDKETENYCEKWKNDIKKTFLTSSKST